MISASTLPAIAFSQNEINLELTSSDYNTGAGQLAVNRISFGDPVGVGATINLQWSGGNVTITAVFSPDESGDQIPAGAGDAAHVNALVGYFAAKYEIARDFDVSYFLYLGSFPSIKLTAKVKGPEYNVTGTANPYLPISTDILGVKMAVRPNIAHHLQLWVKMGSNFSKIWQANLQLDYPITGKTTKNIAPLLHPYLVCSGVNGFGSDRPSLASAAWQACNKTLLPYYAIYAQYYGDTPTVKVLKQTSVAYINLGGLDVPTSAAKTLTDFLRPDVADDSKTRCLRQGSRIKMVQLNQPEFLYWINLTGISKTIKVKFELFFNEGGSVTFDSATQEVAAHEKYALPVGYTQAGIVTQLPSGKTPAYFTARVTTSANAPLSLLYTYQIDSYRQWARYFVYRNALGGFETLYTWGKGQTETSISSENYELLSTNAQSAATGKKQQSNIRLQEKNTVYTGYTSPRTNKILLDFFASEEKYLVKGTAYVPVMVSTESLKEAIDGDTLNGASFEFMPKYDDMIYTDDPNQTDDSNTAIVPVLHPIYFYMASALPAVAADLAGITPATYADTLELASGTSHRMVIIGLQTDKSIDEVINNTAGGFFGDITLSFNEVAAIAISGVAYQFCALVMGVPFPTNQDLKANFI